MVTTVLFDLDGTLLPMDKEAFLKQYFGLVLHKFKELIPPRNMLQYLSAATEAMIADLNPGKTNRQAFLEHFLPLAGQDEETLMPLFDDFYSKEFPVLISYTSPTSQAPRILDELVRRGFDLALASNPIFPAPATRERMCWAGVWDYPWSLITTYEDFHFCKPSPLYYQEILDRLGKRPEECLMVGNDTDEDLPAASLGIRTYLVTDCLIDSGNSPYRPDGSGKLADLPGFIQKLL